MAKGFVRTADVLIIPFVYQPISSCTPLTGIAVANVQLLQQGYKINSPNIRLAARNGYLEVTKFVRRGPGTE